jgi:hypothetical protein
VSGYYPCVAFATHQDVVYSEWSRFGDDALLEIFTVDEFGNAVDRVDSTVNQGLAHVITPMAWYWCGACSQRFRDDWQDVLDHFPADADDEEGEAS